MDKEQLARFLRSRRARITPREVGLPEGGTRRTPGLRRQEVAQLAGMSIDYYIRLEQGRGPRPSRQVLSALGRALMLTAHEREHLFHLAGREQPLGTRPGREVAPGVLLLLESMTTVPAFVMDARYDILAWNRMANLLFGDLDTTPGPQRNVIRWTFRAGGRRWAGRQERDCFARMVVADLRAASARYPGDVCIQELVAEMTALSPAFAELWAAYDVVVERDRHKLVYHPLTGAIRVICQMLLIPDTDQRLVTYVAEPGSASHKALRTLYDAAAGV
ncbi:helix-turn-helix transcriptional regulator [Rhizohabitans arisaemae]|uniref:helix-turn-helix transcriptional regulator n=1 Tax=Rhizohabitans arisaemae TaxID=2720610 RepID=UPI0024B1D86A|nr:helix-turn-helix transcriptional regulator [Rhizohabitans arisaemae]